MSNSDPENADSLEEQEQESKNLTSLAEWARRWLRELRPSVMTSTETEEEEKSETEMETISSPALLPPPSPLPLQEILGESFPSSIDADKVIETVQGIPILAAWRVRTQSQMSSTPFPPLPPPLHLHDDDSVTEPSPMRMLPTAPHPNPNALERKASSRSPSPMLQAQQQQQEVPIPNWMMPLQAIDVPTRRRQLAQAMIISFRLFVRWQDQEEVFDRFITLLHDEYGIAIVDVERLWDRALRTDDDET